MQQDITPNSTEDDFTSDFISESEEIEHDKTHLSATSSRTQQDPLDNIDKVTNNKVYNDGKGYVTRQHILHHSLHCPNPTGKSERKYRVWVKRSLHEQRRDIRLFGPTNCNMQQYYFLKLLREKLR